MFGLEIGYEPRRIQRLTARTVAAIDSLSALRSADPAAIDAIRVVGLLRRNLEDHWMPLLRRIEASDAMVSWLAAPLEQLKFGGGATATELILRLSAADGSQSADRRAAYRSTRYARLSDRGLLRWLEFVGVTDPTGDSFRELASELAQRVAADETFADKLLLLAGTTPAVAFATGAAEFPPGFTSAVLTSMLGSVPWFAGLDGQIEAMAIRTAMTALLTDPDEVLDTLLDGKALFALARWPALDSSIVQRFVTTGLYEAVANDMSRLNDGYAVLGELVRLTNGPLDAGMQPGMARGLAISMTGYIDTLAPAVRQEGTYPIVVIERELDLEIELGTYADVADLFGAMMRDPEAQAALGAVLGAYTNSVVGEMGAHIDDQLGLEPVARFADLLGDATLAEQAELVVEAAAEEATYRRIGNAVGFGVATGMSATGVGVLASKLAAGAVSTATNWIAPVEPAEMPGPSIPASTYDLITVAAVSLVAGDRSLRVELGVAGIGEARWDEIDEQLADIRSSPNSTQRTRGVLRLDRFIEDEVPALGVYLRRVRSAEGVAELAEDRSGPEPD